LGHEGEEAEMLRRKTVGKTSLAKSTYCAVPYTRVTLCGEYCEVEVSCLAGCPATCKAERCGESQPCYTATLWLVVLLPTDWH